MCWHDQIPSQNWNFHIHDRCSCFLLAEILFLSPCKTAHVYRLENNGDRFEWVVYDDKKTLIFHVVVLCRQISLWSRCNHIPNFIPKNFKVWNCIDLNCLIFCLKLLFAFIQFQRRTQSHFLALSAAEKYIFMRGTEPQSPRWSVMWGN